MPNLAYKEYYTKDDYMQWEGDWEIVGGVAYAMSPSPMVTHQFINMKIARQLDEKLDNCKFCHALFETDVEFNDDTIVRPDTIVICYEPQERLNRTPDIVFEIISKSTAKKDEILKFDLYEKEGVKYYALVYGDGEKVKLYKLENYKYVKISDFHDEIYLFELDKCNIEFDFGFIWKR